MTKAGRPLQRPGARGTHPGLAALGLVAALALGSAAHADAPGWALPVAGHGYAVWVPAGDANAPVVVALGGSWDRPEWLCEMLDRAARGRVHLLCVRGRLRPERPPDGPRWSPPPAEAAAKEVRAALEAARAAGLGDVPLVLAGFSRGAGIAAALSASRYALGVAALVLVEGGHGARVAPGLPTAWGCGTRGCARATAKRCRTARGPCIAEADLRVGHSYNPPWEVQGDRLLTWVLTTLNQGDNATSPRDAPEPEPK